MKKYILSILSLAIGLCLFPGCENDGFYYQDEARVRIEGPYIWTAKTDSLEYSFVTSPESVTEINMDVSLYIMGLPASQNRTVNIGIVSEHTTAASNQYVCPAQVTIPANAYTVTFPITLKRTADLQEGTVSLYIKVLPSSDFKPGIKERDHLLIKWNDILSMPKNWSDLEEFFGTFSVVKYRFMINNTGITEFSTDTMSWAQLTNYKIMLKNALDEYNAAHPGNPLKDENGQIITF